jgi:site-specific DNA-methyltransferase (adenine-specific)
VRRIVKTSSPPGGLVADFFAGSGTTGIAAYEAERPFLLVDSSPEAATVMARRCAGLEGVELVGFLA